MAVNWHVWAQSHRWGAIVIALPLLLVVSTGMLLQIKKQWSWVQPPTLRGGGRVPAVSLDTILAAARSCSEAGVSGWPDIDRVDVQPNRGIAKVLTRNRWEVQIDLQTGQVLQVAYRRSDLIEPCTTAPGFTTARSCGFSCRWPPSCWGCGGPACICLFCLSGCATGGDVDGNTQLCRAMWKKAQCRDKETDVMPLLDHFHPPLSRMHPCAW